MIEGFLLSCKVENKSPATISFYKNILDKFQWYLQKFGIETIDATAIIRQLTTEFGILTRLYSRYPTITCKSQLEGEDEKFLALCAGRKFNSQSKENRFVSPMVCLPVTKNE